MATVTVQLPTSLAFLVSNFHSLVNIKLDGGNYLLWRIQVENVMMANGYLEYLEGTVECPSPKIQNADGVESVNPAFTLWKLIDTQLLSCLTASISQATLPYVLGLRHVHEVWESLSNRYNSLSHSHVQELRTRLYSVTKTCTMDKYIDTIKDYAQKLGAAGSPVNEDDLIFHTLRGLPKAFNGFKTAVRTRGGTITFAELINLLNGEDLQLLQESDAEISSVLVATHGNKNTAQASSIGDLLTSSTSVPQVQFPMSTVPSQFGVPMQPPQPTQFMPSLSSQFGVTVQSPQSTQFSQVSPPFQSQNQLHFLPSSYYPTPNFRSFSRGRGRGPRMPCDICGRLNHSTNFCYYKGQLQTSFDQWRGSSTSWMPSGYPTGMPIFRPGVSMPMSPMHSVPFTGPRAPMPNTSMVRSPAQQSPGVSSFAGFTEAYTLPYMSPTPSTGSTGLHGFTEAYSQPYMVPGSSGSSYGFPVSSTQLASTGHGSPGDYNTALGATSSHFSHASHPWYFDSGATNHITNNMQYLHQPQSAPIGNGILVGNGSTLPVTHTGKGQEHTQSFVQGPLSQGPISTSDLL